MTSQTELNEKEIEERRARGMKCRGVFAGCAIHAIGAWVLSLIVGGYATIFGNWFYQFLYLIPVQLTLYLTKMPKEFMRGIWMTAWVVVALYLTYFLIIFWAVARLVESE
jgi:hypothetical protein